MINLQQTTLKMSKTKRRKIALNELTIRDLSLLLRHQKASVCVILTFANVIKCFGTVVIIQKKIFSVTVKVGHR